jgi:hypothetical protein
MPSGSKRFQRQFERYRRGEPVRSYETKWLAYVKEQGEDRLVGNLGGGNKIAEIKAAAGASGAGSKRRRLPPTGVRRLNGAAAELPHHQTSVNRRSSRNFPKNPTSHPRRPWRSDQFSGI